jgi:hypothetical protein
MEGIDPAADLELSRLELHKANGGEVDRAHLRTISSSRASENKKLILSLHILLPYELALSFRDGAFFFSGHMTQGAQRAILSRGP